MKTKCISAIAAIALMSSFTPTALAADEPLRLQPSSEWTVSYQEDSCRMGRKFGSGDDEVFVIFTRTEPSDSFRTLFSGKPVRARSGERPLKIKFGSGGMEKEADFFPGDMGEDRPAVILMGEQRIVPLTDAQQKMVNGREWDDAYIPFPVSPEREAAASWIWLDLPSKDPIILETGSLGKPFEAMRKCTDELMLHWGIDVEKHKNLTREVTPASYPGKWVTYKDYPSKMRTRGAQAIVQFRLSVDTSGKPTACHIQESTRPQEFEDATCEALMKRAKFKPALDGDGNPVASYYINTVRFQMG